MSYREARDALEATDGNLVDALALLDDRSRKEGIETTTIGGVLQEVEEVLQAGPVSGVRVRLGSHIIRELPLRVTVVGALALGIIAVLASRLSVDLAHEEE